MEKINFIIRNELPEDYKAVREINIKAFGQEAEANLVEKLRDADCDVPEEIFMVLVLDKIEPINDGLVKYRKEFASLEG